MDCGIISMIPCGIGAERRSRTQLDEVPNKAHDEKANTDGLADLEELLLVRCKKRTELVAPHDQTA